MGSVVLNLYVSIIDKHRSKYKCGHKYISWTVCYFELHINGESSLIQICYRNSNGVQGTDDNQFEPGIHHAPMLSIGTLFNPSKHWTKNLKGVHSPKLIFWSTGLKQKYGAHHTYNVSV